METKKNCWFDQQWVCIRGIYRLGNIILTWQVIIKLLLLPNGIFFIYLSFMIYLSVFPSEQILFYKVLHYFSRFFWWKTQIDVNVDCSRMLIKKCSLNHKSNWIFIPQIWKKYKYMQISPMFHLNLRKILL